MMMFKSATPVSESEAGEVFREFSWQLSGILQRTAKTRVMKKTTNTRPAPKTTTAKRAARAC